MINVEHTYATDLAIFTLAVLEQDAKNIAFSEGPTTWFEFAEAIKLFKFKY